MKTIIVSREDIAGMNIAEHLINSFGFNETEMEFDGNKIYEKEDFQLVTINELQVYADNLDSIETELFIFASRHASRTGPTTFTTHALGNWGKAELGGKQHELVPTYANLLKNYLLGLQKTRDEKGLDYSVTLECTHHGPSLTKPVVFIEIGSNETHWKDKKGAEVIAETIMKYTNLEGDNTIAIALGGGHYCPEFTKLVLRKDYALSHICPKYALEFFDEEMLQKAIANTKEPVQEFVIDYKGLGAERERILSILEKSDLPIRRVRKLLK